MTLAETQARFAALVTAPEAPAAEAAEAFLRGTPDLPALDRLGIYAGMYRARLVDALRETFPALAALLGDRGFDALAGEYVAAHPSEHHDVGRLGRRLAAWLRDDSSPTRPDLADLAELEWARQESFFAPPAQPAGPGALAALGAEGFAVATLRLTPALHLLRLAHDVTEAWRCAEGPEPRPPAPSPTAVAVWREGYDVFHARLPEEEAKALAAASAGAPLAEVLSHFAARPDPAAAAGAALGGWLRAGWIAAVVPP